MLAFIDNTREAGHRIKQALADALQGAGYTVATIGRGADYASFNIPWEYSEPAAITIGSDFREVEVEGLQLWDICKGSIFYDVGALRETDPECVRSAAARHYARALAFRRLMDEIITTRAPSLFVVWGGMFCESQLIRLAALDAGIPCFATEFSLDPSRFYFDCAGVIGNRHSFGQVWQHMRGRRLSATQSDWISRWIAENYRGKVKAQPEPGITASYWHRIFRPPLLNVLLIGQCYVDTVVTMDSPLYGTTLQAYDEVANACRDLPINLIIKPHPGDRPEIKSTLIGKYAEHPNVFVVPDNSGVSVYALMDVSHVGITINSQAGLEMLARGKNVLTLGDAFYANKGFGIALSAPDTLKSSIKALLSRAYLAPEASSNVRHYLYHFLNSYLVAFDQAHYRIPEILSAPNPLYPARPGASLRAGSVCFHADGRAGPKSAGLRVVMVHPSPRFGGSGYYLQELARYLVRAGANVLVLAEGSCPLFEDGVHWRQLAFDGPLLARDLKRLVFAFEPNVVYQVGVRSKSMRAALEILLATNAKLIVQSEDDDTLPFQQKYPKPDRTLLSMLDKPSISADDVKQFLSRLDFDFLGRVLLDPDHYRWVEPALRILCYRLAAAHTAIWYPMAESLAARFGKRVLVIPPVVTLSEFDPRPIDASERASILGRFKIDPTTFVFFISGTIYNYSDEFEAFVRAVALLRRRTRRKLTLVVAGRAREQVHGRAKAELARQVSYRSLGVPDDGTYYDMLKAADLVCCPGFPDEFNRLRLPSRLVKAMALGRPIVTFRRGFGESLTDGENGYLLDGTDPELWAEALERCFDRERNSAVGQAGRRFAEQHFETEVVGPELKRVLEGAAGIRGATQATETVQASEESRMSSTPNVAASFGTTRARRKLRKLCRTPVAFIRDSSLVVALQHRAGFLLRKSAWRDLKGGTA